MKIVLATTTRFDTPGGAERSLLELAGYLADHQCEVVILNMHSGERPSDETAGDVFYEMPAGVRLQAVRVMRSANRAARVRNRMWTLAYRLSHAPRFYYQLNRPLIHAWRQAVLDEQPDIVIGFMPGTFVPLARALKGAGIPVIAAHRNDPAYYKVEKEVVHDALQFVSHNVVLLEAFRGYFPPALRSEVVVIPNPVYPAAAMADVALHEGEKTIITTGRLVDQKNQVLLIRSFALLAERYLDWRVNIFGSGARRAELQALVGELGLQDRVSLLAPVKDIFSELMKAHIYAFPSVYEGWGRGLTEAMAHGLPAVGLRDCHATHMLLTASGGGLLAGNDPADFAAQLEALMKDPALRQQMGSRGAAFVRQFDPDRVHGQWLELIRDAVARNR
jgi:glycosyltransferase involved in cell wall biosynthesis